MTEQGYTNAPGGVWYFFTGMVLWLGGQDNWLVVGDRCLPSHLDGVGTRCGRVHVPNVRYVRGVRVESTEGIRPPDGVRASNTSPHLRIPEQV
jgi:hypothetical protein